MLGFLLQGNLGIAATEQVAQIIAQKVDEGAGVLFAVLVDQAGNGGNGVEIKMRANLTAKKFTRQWQIKAT